jgi:hypothetical protein
MVKIWNPRAIISALAFYALGPSFSLLNFEVTIAYILVSMGKLTKRDGCGAYTKVFLP